MAESGQLRVVHGLLLPGKVIGDGRYRLLQRTGIDDRDGAQLWRARDGQLRREVAATVLTGDPADTAAAGLARRSLEQAAYPSEIDHPAVARVLDVLSVDDGLPRSEGVLGMVVAEWSRGPGLTDLIARHPPPAADACRLLEPLAAAVGQAHHRGLVLGVRNPLRLRTGPGGRVRLAFPGPPAQVRRPDDVRGLGAILYLLLTGRWPTGLPTATPRDLRPGVPPELSEVAMRSLEDTRTGGIGTSDTLLQVLQQVGEEAERTDELPPVPADPDGAVWTTKPPRNDPTRRKKLAVATALLMIMTLAVVVWIGAEIAGVFAEDTSASGGPSAVLTVPSTPPPSSAVTTNQPANPAPPPPAAVEVLNISGDADSAGKAAQAIDGNPATSWKTDAYFQQFPALKPGIGLIVSFNQPTTVAHITIDSPSAGTQLEVRAAPSPHPNLPDTTLAGTATLTGARTTADLHIPAPTQHILIWITHLAGTNGHYQSVINELTFTP